MHVNVHSCISFYCAELATEKTTNALVEVALELWKLAKLAREKGK